MPLEYRDRPVAEFHDLFHIGRNQQDRHTFITEVMDDTVYVTAGSGASPLAAVASGAPRKISPSGSVSAISTAVDCSACTAAVPDVLLWSDEADAEL